MSRKNATTSATPSTPSPGPILDDALTRWHKRWVAALDVIEGLHAYLAAPPPEGEPCERLHLALEVWTRLAPPTREPTPWKTSAERWADRIAGPHRREALIDAFGQVLIELERIIAASLDAGADDSSLIRSADFAELRTIDSGAMMPDGTPIYYAVGIVGSLPAGHPARSLLPDDDQYQHSRRVPGLVLGPMQARGHSRPWYTVRDAIELTRYFRSQQLLKIAEEEAETRREAERERLQFWSSPLGILQRQQAELDRLRAADKIPPPPRPKRLG